MKKEQAVDINLEKKPKKLEFYRLSDSSSFYIGSGIVNPLMCGRCGAVIGSKLDHTKFHNDVESEQFQIVIKNPKIRRGPKVQIQKV